MERLKKIEGLPANCLSVENIYELKDRDFAPFLYKQMGPLFNIAQINHGLMEYLSEMNRAHEIAKIRPPPNFKLGVQGIIQFIPVLFSGMCCSNFKFIQN